MNYRVVFSPEAEEHLAALYRHIATASSPAIAARYTEAIVSYCEGLRTIPHRGTMRDDVRPGLRITNYKKRAVIAFDVEAEQDFRHRCLLRWAGLRNDPPGRLRGRPRVLNPCRMISSGS